MITIEIKKSKKLDFDYSAFVSFHYNQNIVDTIKQLPFKYYDMNTKTWEIPLNKVSYLQERLFPTKFNIIDNSNKLHEFQSLKLDFEYTPKTKPFEHQLEGLKYGMENDRWFLGDEQGCVSGDSYVKIKEHGKPATRDIKIKNLKKAFDRDKTIQIKTLVNGRFAYMPIKDVLDKNIQDTIDIELENTHLQCTADHLIYTDKGWVEAGKLKVGDKVFTNGTQACPLCGSTKNLVTYKYSKFLGYCKSCMYKSRNGTKYNEVTKKLDADGYVRLFGKNTRFMPNYDKVYGMGIYEHHQVWYENTGHIVDTTKEVIHHKNGIKTDNRFENLQLMSIQEHDKLHSDTKKNHLYQFNENLDYIERKGTKIYLVPKLQEIQHIKNAGKQHVWDISINDTEIHNFICNGIVVHNCGKTKQVIDIAVARKIKYGYKHCLIVCGVNTLKWNWVNEIITHSNEKAHILGQRRLKNGKVKIGSTKDKLDDLQHALLENDNLPYFIITNIESFRDKQIADTVKKLCDKNVISMCAIDECHKCKNPTSQQTKGFLKCLPKCRIAMTGTPIMNSPLDTFIILKWLGYETHSFTAFKNHYCIMGGYGGYEVVGYRNLPELHDKVNEIMLRRLKTDVFDLPEKMYIDEFVEMTTEQAKIYKEVRTDLKQHIDKIVNSIDPLSEMIRLRQATGYTGILSSTIQESAKLDRMEEIVEEARSNKRQVVIFSNWTQMTDIIYSKLRVKYATACITGATKDNERQTAVDDFQIGRAVILVGTIGAMGTGLTLTAGTVVIFLDHPWNRALYDQAVDRCHRIGQTQSITIYNLMCKDTIDERIWNIVKTKGQMSDRIIDNTVTNKLDEIKFLLDL